MGYVKNELLDLKCQVHYCVEGGLGKVESQ